MFHLRIIIQESAGTFSILPVSLYKTKKLPLPFYPTSLPVYPLAKRAGEPGKEKTVILSCASGARSGVEAGLLKRQGFENVINAGSWKNILQTGAGALPGPDV